MQILAGTSGFSYDAWTGPFYPEGLAARKRLAYYAQRLPVVEINNTFYRLPKASVIESWAGQVPEGFRFAIKASRRITHMKRLRDAGDETDYLLRTVGGLGARLGCLLFQLPPNLRCDLERLDAFLELLPDGTPAAFEFRHPSWHDAPVFERLRARAFACVQADTDDEPATELVSTAPWGYVRLRREGYDRAALADWVQRLRASGWDEAYVFLKHEDAGAGPKLAGELLALATRAAERRAPAKRGAATRRAEEAS